MKEVTGFMEVDKETLTQMLVTKAIEDINAGIIRGQDPDAVKINRVTQNIKLLEELTK